MVSISTGKDDVRKKDRESVAECKQAVREGKVDAIFINEVSRLSRDSIAGRLFIREFNDEYKIYDNGRLPSSNGAGFLRDEERDPRERGWLLRDGLAESWGSCRREEQRRADQGRC